MTNKDKFLNLVSGKDTKVAKEISERRKNRDLRRASKRIAIQILAALKQRSMTQKNLADIMEVSPQYVNKLVKGKENLTLDTIVKLEKILAIEILTSHKESKVIQTTLLITESYHPPYTMSNYSDYNYKRSFSSITDCN